MARMRPSRDFEPTLCSVPDSASLDCEGEILRRFRALPEDRLAFLRSAAEIASAAGCGLYWVGGGVRDLWLGQNEVDVDLVVDGDLAPFARSLAARLGAGLRTHPQFMTAAMIMAGGFRVDLARARKESYPGPGSLPVVEPGSIASDLERRDFSINCLAIPLAPAFGERLIDPCGGIADLLRGRLRTLHPDSFRDDPTRLFRALEFEARFGFEISSETLSEVAVAVAEGVVSMLSPARLRAALKRALGRSENALGVFRRLRELNLLNAIDPRLADARSAEERFEAALGELAGRRDGGWQGRPEGAFRLALLCLAFDLQAAERAAFGSRLDLPAPELELVTRGPDRVQRALSGLGSNILASAAHDLVGPLTEEELAVLASQSAAARGWVRRELAEMRETRLAIGGRDLIAAGLAAGPEVGRALELTLKARLDGRIEAGDELDFALQTAANAAAEESS